MTHDEKLNSILNSYLFAETFRLKNDPKYSKLTFDFIITTQCKEIEDWEKEFLKERLFEDGYLKENGIGRGEPFLLTNSGKVFIQSGGYVKQRERQTTKDKLNDDNLKTNIFNRRNTIVMVVLTFIGVMIALLTLIFKD
jgi:hypothetical protein